MPGLVALGVWNWVTCRQLLFARSALLAGSGGAEPRSTYSALVRASLGPIGVMVFEGALCVLMLGVCASMQIQARLRLEPSTPFEPITR